MAKFNKNDPVTKIMSTRVTVASAGVKLSELAEFFKTSPLKHVPVVDGNRRLVGIISENDIQKLNYADALGEDERSVFAHLDATKSLDDVMTKDPVTITPEANIRIAAEKLAHDEFHALPVVKDGNVVGMVTSADLLNYFVGIY